MEHNFFCRWCICWKMNANKSAGKDKKQQQRCLIRCKAHNARKNKKKKKCGDSKRRWTQQWAAAETADKDKLATEKNCNIKSWLLDAQQNHAHFVRMCQKLCEMLISLLITKKMSERKARVREKKETSSANTHIPFLASFFLFRVCVFVLISFIFFLWFTVICPFSMPLNNQHKLLSQLIQFWDPVDFFCSFEQINRATNEWVCCSCSHQIKNLICKNLIFLFSLARSVTTTTIYAFVLQTHFLLHKRVHFFTKKSVCSSAFVRSELFSSFIRLCVFCLVDAVFDIYFLFGSFWKFVNFYELKA